MAEETENTEGKKDKKEAPPKKGAPAWMATFSDLVTLLLTFFVLLLSFAKTETKKYEAALGSVRNAFGGAVLKQGEVIQRGKSPDDSPTMMESQDPIKPFPIEFLTMEGLLDKHEINRESTEELKMMKGDLDQYDLGEMVDIYEVAEGIKVKMKDHIYFNEGTTHIQKIAIESFEKMTNLIKEKKWKIFVEGYASQGEEGKNGEDAFVLSSKRAIEVSKSLARRGVPMSSISTVFYGDTRPIMLPEELQNKRPILERRVEFLIRKTDLHTEGHKVSAQ